jgi:Flp pilus assembly protein TadG
LSSYGFSNAKSNEAGQAMVLVLLALSLFLLAALGLVIDGSHVYAQRQLAQAAADAAAQAGIYSIFNGTNATGTHQFAVNAGTTYTCSSGDARTPCYYAQTLNDFNTTASDTVTYTPNPSGVSVPSLSAQDSINLLQAKIQRNVPATVMKWIGWSTIPVSASGTAGILTALAPIPILVLHPTQQGAFSINGGGGTCTAGSGACSVNISGGPTRSIQVNSSSTCSVSGNGGTCASTSGTVDLSQAGPSGNGASFGDVGGPGTYPGTLLPSGNYLQPAGVMNDPLLSMSAPPQPTTSGTSTTVSPGTDACPSNLATLTSQTNCTMYSPGYYANGLNLSGVFAIFRPGIYYINHNGFQLGSNTIARVATSVAYSSDPTPAGDPAHTSWTSGILVYNSPQSPVRSNKDYISIASNSGQINNHNFPDATACGTDGAGNALAGNCFIGANGGALTAAQCASGTASASYYGTVFFQDRSTATTLQHLINGGGGLSLKGTVYLTHTVAGINADSTYQELDLQGNSGSTTKLQGEIIADVLSIGGTAGVTMNLSTLACYTVRQIALVK